MLHYVPQHGLLLCTVCSQVPSDSWFLWWFSCAYCAVCVAESAAPAASGPPEDEDLAAVRNQLKESNTEAKVSYACTGHHVPSQAAHGQLGHCILQGHGTTMPA